MKRVKFSLILFTTCILVSCGGNGSSGSNSGNSFVSGLKGHMDSYLNSDVNVIQQALPQIMVIPADQTLKSYGALKQTSIDGKQFTVRDYKKYLLADDSFPRIASYIQNAFTKKRYPIVDFEQTLKQLDTRAAMDIADGLQQDAKTLLLQTARPDIILELNYHNTSSLTSHDYISKNVNYTLSAFDAYTSKSIASVTSKNMKGDSTTEIIQKDMQEQLPGLMSDIQDYFSDILTYGREVTVRILVDRNSNVNLQDLSIEGDTYSDWIFDYMKVHSVKGACKMQINTKNELSFVEVRIPLLNDDGTQYAVFDFTRDLQKNLRRNLGLQSTNNSQGLGEVVLTVKGI